MKVVAILLLLAVAAYARPPQGSGKGSGSGSGSGSGAGKPEDAGAKLFMSLVKLCMGLEERSGDDDKRSWEAVFGLFGSVCEGIKNAIGDDLAKLTPNERMIGEERSGPSPTADLPSQSGDRRPHHMGGSGRGSQQERSGPSPTADLPSQSGDRRPHHMGGSGRGSQQERSGPSPTADLPSQSGDRRPHHMGGSGDRSGPSPTADLPSQSGDRRPHHMSGGRRHDERSGPSMNESPEQKLLSICFALAEMGEQMDDGQDKRGADELNEVLKGMEQVCLAAFVEAQAMADD